MHHDLIWLLVPLGAVLWRLGGGAFTTLTGLSFGTDPARVLRACIALVFPFCLGWWGGLVPVALFWGVCLGGWGPYQGMGIAPTFQEMSWQDFLPELFGLEVGTIAYDFFGMWVSGLCCMILPAAAVAFGMGWHPALLILACAWGFSPCYLLARVIPWSIPGFASGQEWGEVFVGAMIGAVFAAVLAGY